MEFFKNCDVFKKTESEILIKHLVAIWRALELLKLKKIYLYSLSSIGVKPECVFSLFFDKVPFLHLTVYNRLHLIVILY